MAIMVFSQWINGLRANFAGSHLGSLCLDTGMGHYLFLLGLVLTGWSVGAAELPAGGQEMLPSPEMKAYVGRAAEQGASAETVPVSGRSFTTAQRLLLPQRPAHPWDAGARSSLAVELKLGDVGMVVFEARALPLSGQNPDAAEATGIVYLEEVNPPDYAKAAQLGFKCGPQWQEYFLAFEAGLTLEAGKGALVFHLGQQAQAFEIGPVRVLNYAKSLAIKDLPRTRVTYRGREPEAAWRKEATTRIAQHRMAPLTITATDAAGQPLANAAVKLRQVRSAFGFGSAVTAQWLTKEGADGETYRRIVDECFSRVVFENDLKMEAWEGSLENTADSSFQWNNTLKASEWLQQRNLGIRGHYLCWAPWEPWSEKLKAEPDKIKQRILTHLPRIASEVGSRVMEWDAINHLAGWDKNIDEATGVDFYTEIMKAARAATKLPLWVNEDQILRPDRQQEDYYKRIQKLIADGQKPDGIGNQGHFDDTFLPSPMDILANSDRFAALVPALQITEFDVLVNGDEQLEADYLRDFLTVCYSHPAYTGFLIWGFWESSHWKPQTALWRKDWSEKPSAKVWKELVNNQWATKAEGQTGPAGDYQINAHLGTYEITLTANGKTATTRTTLTKTSGPVTVQLP
jgi:endo-1,4-beta-xylanase